MSVRLRFLPRSPTPPPPPRRGFYRIMELPSLRLLAVGSEDEDVIWRCSFVRRRQTSDTFCGSRNNAHVTRNSAQSRSPLMAIRPHPPSFIPVILFALSCPPLHPKSRGHSALQLDLGYARARAQCIPIVSSTDVTGFFWVRVHFLVYRIIIPLTDSSTFI